MFCMTIGQLLAWPRGRCQRCCQMRLSEASLRFFHHPIQKNMMNDVSPLNIKTGDQSAKALSVELEQIFTLRDVRKLWWWMKHWLRLIDTSNHAPCWDLIFPVSCPDFVDFVTWRMPLGWIWGNRYLFVRLWSKQCASSWHSTCRHQREITRNLWILCVFPRPHLSLNVAWVAVLSVSSSPWLCNSKQLFVRGSACVSTHSCNPVYIKVCMTVYVCVILSQTDVNPSTPHHTDRRLLIPGFLSLICYRRCGLQQTNWRVAAGKWLYMTCLFPISRRINQEKIGSSFSGDTSPATYVHSKMWSCFWLIQQ